MNHTLRVSVDHLLEGVQVIAPDWRYLYVNRTAAEQGQRSVEELVGRTMMDCYPGIVDTPMFTALQRVMASRKGETLQNEFAFPTGERRWFDLVIEPVPDGVCVLSLDITERRRTDLEAHHAQRMEAIGRLAGGVAHDFNNQLTAILGFTELLLEAHPDPALQRDLGAIRDAAQRSAALTTQLLAFSRRQPLRVEALDVNGIVRGMGALLRRLLGEDIACDLRVHADPVMIRADAQRLENALTNLAVNARDAMPTGGRLTISTDVVELTSDDARQHPSMSNGRYAVLSVSDTGFGMDPATKARVFEPFFTTKAPGHGTGLGLSTVYGIVKQLEGFIWVYSEIGRGTMFRLYFPTTGEAQQARPASSGPIPAHTRSARILVVEDDRGVLELVTRTLRRHGHIVMQARHADEARERLRELATPPDLVIFDVVLPGESGPDLARQLPIGTSRVLFMSGYSEQHIERRGFDGAFTLLEKPFTSQELLRHVQEALTRP